MESSLELMCPKCGIEKMTKSAWLSGSVAECLRCQVFIDYSPDGSPRSSLIAQDGDLRPPAGVRVERCDVSNPKPEQGAAYRSMNAMAEVFSIKTRGKV